MEKIELYQLRYVLFFNCDMYSRISRERFLKGINVIPYVFAVLYT